MSKECLQRLDVAIEAHRRDVYSSILVSCEIVVEVVKSLENMV
jgi:hypothetical protein